MSDFKVTINLPEGRFDICREGFAYEGDYGEWWWMPLEQAEVRLNAALRSVQAILEVEGSGSQLTPVRAAQVRPGVGEVEASSLRGGGDDAPSPTSCCGEGCCANFCTGR